MWNRRSRRQTVSLTVNCNESGVVFQSIEMEDYIESILSNVKFGIINTVNIPFHGLPFHNSKTIPYSWRLHTPIQGLIWCFNISTMKRYSISHPTILFAVNTLNLLLLHHWHFDFLETFMESTTKVFRWVCGIFEWEWIYTKKME